MKVAFKRTTPNVRSSLSTSKIMFELMLALIVVTGFSFYYQFSIGSEYGIKTVGIVATSLITAYVVEALYFVLTKEKNVLKAIRNSFPCVTALIFALTLSIGTPYYVVAIGSAVAIIFGKLVYGGFGQNIFNPALVGRVFVALSYAGVMTTTLSTSTDVTSSATVVAQMASNHWIVMPAQSIIDLALGFRQGSLGETFGLLIIVLGVVLAIRKVLDYRIPLFYIATAFIISFAVGFYQGLNPINFALTQIFIGGLLFGAVFMMTDPVTSPTSLMGKIIFSIGAAFITMLIRFKANTPEGVMFAILIMNMLAPLIERYTAGASNSHLNRKRITVTAFILASVVIMLPISSLSMGIAFPGFKRETVKTTKAWCEDPVQKDFGITCEFSGEVSDEATITNHPVATNSIIRRNTTLKFEVAAAPILAKVIGVQNGGYIVSTVGFHGEMKVLVVLDSQNKSVLQVKVLEHEETEEYGNALINGKQPAETDDEAYKTFFNTVLNNQPFAFDASVDTATGATKTANGIMQAVQAAIEFDQLATVENVEGRSVKVTSEGFHGGVTLTVTVSNEGVVENVKVGNHEETEGYGDSILSKQLPEAGDAAIAQAFIDAIFGGKSTAADIAGIDTHTGATVTSNAIQIAILRAIVEATR